MSKQMLFVIVLIGLVLSVIGGTSKASAAADEGHKDQSVNCNCADYGHPGWIPTGNTSGTYGKDWWCVQPTETPTPKPTKTPKRKAIPSAMAEPCPRLALRC